MPYTPPSIAGLTNVNISAGISSNDLTNVVFSNSNGISFGLNGSTITGTVATNYQSQGAYLTTAMLSNASSVFAGVGETVTTTAGTDLKLTVDTAGVNIAHPVWLTTAQPVGAYLTTAMLSNQSSLFAGIGETVGTTAGTDLVMTVDTAGVSIGYPKWITTYAAQSNQPVAASGSNGSFLFSTLQFVTGNGASFYTDATGIRISYTVPSVPAQSVQPVAASGSNGSFLFSTLQFVTGNGASFYTDATGIRLSYTVPAAQSAQPVAASGSNGSFLFSTLQFVTGNGATFYTDATGIRLSYTVPAAGGDAIRGIAANGSTATTNTVVFSNSNNISFGFGAAGNSTVLTADVGLAASNSLGSFTFKTINFSNANNVTFGTSAGGIITASVAAPGGGVVMTNFFEPFNLADGTATTSHSLSQINIQPFVLPYALSFGQINLIGVGTVPATSISNQLSARLTNSTQRFIYSNLYTIGNTNFVDLFLFSQGSGKFSTEIETFASTRNSFATNYQFTNWGDATLTNASGGSLRGSQTISMTISYPFMTSAQSIDGASTHTTWQSGYTTWQSNINNSSLFTFSTSAARTLSIGSIYPATVGWSGPKMINLNFGTSLTAGQYWLGVLRHSSSSGSSTTNHSFTGAAGTGNSFSTTYNSTAMANTQSIQWAGKTMNTFTSLGSLGFITTNNMAPMVGLGSFSGTWASDTTYLNNAVNPAGAIAFTQLRAGVSYFQSWFQMGSNRMV